MNFRNERVRQEMNDIFEFWLDQGVSGFRLLSAPYLYEAEDLSLNDTPDESRTKNLEETYLYVGEIRSILQRYEDNDGEHRVLLIGNCSNISFQVDFLDFFVALSPDSLELKLPLGLQITEILFILFYRSRKQRY